MEKNTGSFLIIGILVLLSLVFVLNGVKLHSQAAAEVTNLDWMIEQYYSVSKSERDTAEPGSDLNAQFIEIQKAPAKINKYRALGVGKAIISTYLLLAAILVSLIAIPPRLKDAMRHN